VTLEFKGLSGRPPFDDPELRREFLRRLNDTAGVSIPETAMMSRPRFRLVVLSSPEALKSFKEALDWFCETARSHIEDHARREAEDFIDSVP
jgi:hypothetical protein